MNQEQRQAITEAARATLERSRTTFEELLHVEDGDGFLLPDDWADACRQRKVDIDAALAALESVSPVEPACECLARTALRELLECHACGGFIEPDDDVLDSARAAISTPCPARQVEG